MFIEYSIETKNIFSFLIPMFSPKANMNIFFLYHHIAICMCNILKCRFKHLYLTLGNTCGIVTKFDVHASLRVRILQIECVVLWLA
jgi:hypothetical protein